MSESITPHILLVDDDPSVREVYATLLKQECPYQVSTAKSPHEALDFLKLHRVQVLVSDVHMPGMNGIEFISTVKKHWPQVPIIVMSARSTGTMEEQALKCGSLTLLEKPVKSEVLIREIEHALEVAKHYRKHRSVLVADDHRETREFLKTILDEAGYDVTLAADGQEAVEVVNGGATKFDIALIDLNMPRLPGPEAIVQLRKLAPATLIILLTGEATSQRIHEAYHAGGFTLIRKPLDIHAFLDAFASYERESDILKAEVAEKEALARQPVTRKFIRWWGENVSRPADNKKRSRMQFVVVMILSVIIALALGVVVDHVLSVMKDFEHRLDSIERIDQNMEWDKQRKQRIDEQQKRGK